LKNVWSGSLARKGEKRERSMEKGSEWLNVITELNGETCRIAL